MGSGVRTDEEHLSCCTGVVEGDKLYTVDTIYGSLLEYDMKDYTHRILTHMDPIRAFRGQYRIKKLIKIKDIFYFFMEDSYDVISWSATEHKFCVYKGGQKKDQRRSVVSDAFLSGDKIWICPAYSDQPFRCFDIAAQKLTGHASIEQKILEQGIELAGGHPIFVSVEGDTLWCAVYDTPYIVSGPMAGGSWDCYSFDSFGHISNVCYDGRDLWIYFMYLNIFLSWRPDQGIIDTFEVSDPGLDMGSGDPFRYVYGSGDHIYVIPTYDNDVYVVHRKTKEAEATGFSQKYERTDARPYVPLSYACIRTEDCLVLLPYAIDTIVVIDMEDGKMRYIDAVLDQADKNAHLEAIWPPDGMTERKWLRLQDYISYVVSRDTGTIEYEKKEICGEMIIHEIKR